MKAIAKITFLFIIHFLAFFSRAQCPAEVAVNNFIDFLQGDFVYYPPSNSFYQSFTMSNDGYVEEIVWQTASGGGGFGSGNVVVEIRTGEGTSGTLLYTHPEFYLSGTGNKYIIIPSENAPFLNANTKYSIVFKGVADHIFIRSSYNSYSGGLLNGSSGADLKFRVDTYISLPGQAPIITGEMEVCDANPITVSSAPQPGNTLQWYLEDEPIAGETSNDLTISVGGRYRVLETNQDGCSIFSEDHIVNDFSDLLEVNTNDFYLWEQLWNGTSILLTESGTYEDLEVVDPGCDILHTLILNLGKSPINDACGNVIELNASNDYIQIPDALNFSNDTYTIEGFFKTASETQMDLFSATSGSSHGILIEMNNGNFRFLNRDGGSDDISGTNDYADGLWHHFAAVKNGSDATLYIDGEMEASKTGSTVNVLTNLSAIVGQLSTSSTDRNFQGQLDELTVWDKALTESDIQSGITQTPDLSDPQLLLYYNFDEGYKDKVFNLSNSSNEFGSFKNTASDPLKLEDGTVGGNTVLSETNVTVTCGTTYTWNVNGMEYSESISDTVTTTSMEGCQVLEILNLTVEQAIYNVVPVSSIDSYTWYENDSTYFFSTRDTVEVAPQNGCLNFLVLDLDLQLTPENTTCQTVLHFDGDDFITFSDNDLQLSGDYTIEGWFKGGGDAQHIMSNPANSFFFEIQNGAKMRLLSNNKNLFSDASDLNDNEWHHFAGVRDTTDRTLTLYIDGEESGSTTYPGSQTNFGKITMGRQESSDGRYLNGSLDEIRIWNYRRTIEQLRDGIRLQLSGSESGLVRYYNFNEGSGLTVNDLAGANNGTINGDGAETDSWTLEDGTMVTASQAASITFPPIAAKTYGDMSFTLNATVDSPHEIIYTSEYDTVASIVGDEVFIHGLGTTTITATQEGGVIDGVCYDFTSTAQILTVNAAPLTVFADDLIITYGEDPASLLSVTYSGFVNGEDETTADLTGTLTFEAITETNASAIPYADVIVPSGLSSDNYSISYESGDLTINAAPIEVTADPQSKVFGEADPELTYQITSGMLIGGDDFTGSLMRLAGEDAGTYGIEQGDLSLSSNYMITYVGADLTIIKAPQTIVFQALPEIVFLGESNSADLIATGGGSGIPVVFSISGDPIATIKSGVLLFFGAGEVTVTASQAGNDNYEAAADVEQIITVNKSPQSITFDALEDKTFGGADFDLTATASSGLEVAYVSSDETVATVSGNTVTIVGAGSTAITASQAGDDDYEAATDVQQTLTINKADQAITFDAIADIDIASATAVTLIASSDGGLPISFTLLAGDGTITGTTLTVNRTGSFRVEASQAGNTNYNAATAVTQSFTVTDSRKTNQTIDFPVITDKQYGDVFTLTATSTSNLPVSYKVISGPATVSGEEIQVVGIGIVTIEANQGGDESFNAATSVTQSFNVDKATLTVTADDQTKIYNTENPTLTISYGGFNGGDTEADLEAVPSASTTAEAASDAGTYPIIVSGGGDNNYDFQYVAGTLTITKAAAAITLSDLEQEADGTAKEPMVTTDPANLNVTITYAAGAAPTTAGDYAFTATIQETNYEGEESGTLRLTQVLGLFNTSVSIYPNPAQDFLKIESEGPLQVEVMDLAGRAILKSTSEDDIDILQLSSGTYLLKLTNEAGKTETIRFIKSN